MKKKISTLLLLVASTLNIIEANGKNLTTTFANPDDIKITIEICIIDYAGQKHCKTKTITIESELDLNLNLGTINL